MKKLLLFSFLVLISSTLCRAQTSSLTLSASKVAAIREYNGVGDGVNSVEEHSLNKELLKVTDLLGRETKGTKNEVLFYIYDDGTVEKRIVID